MKDKTKNTVLCSFWVASSAGGMTCFTVAVYRLTDSAAWQAVMVLLAFAVVAAAIDASRTYMAAWSTEKQAESKPKKR